MSTLFKKYDIFNKSKAGICILLICSICMISLSAFSIYKNREKLAKVIYYSIAVFTASTWGIMTGIKNAKELKKEKNPA